MEVLKKLDCRGLPLVGADDGRDDGVDGVHDMSEQVRYDAFLLLVRFS